MKRFVSFLSAAAVLISVFAISIFFTPSVAAVDTVTFTNTTQLDNINNITTATIPWTGTNNWAVYGGNLASSAITINGSSPNKYVTAALPSNLTASSLQIGMKTTAVCQTGRNCLTFWLDLSDSSVTANISIPVSFVIGMTSGGNGGWAVPQSGKTYYLQPETGAAITKTVTTTGNIDVAKGFKGYVVLPYTCYTQWIQDCLNNQSWAANGPIQNWVTTFPSTMSSYNVIVGSFNNAYYTITTTSSTATSSTVTSSGSSQTTVYPTTVSDILLNRGMGWVLYGTPSNQTTATMAKGTTGYERYEWRALNTANGTYNWTSVDNSISAWAAQGKRYGFGVMSVDTFGGALINGLYYVSPKWIFDAGCQYTLGHSEANENLVYVIPVWTDSLYKSYQSSFATALANKYDTNDNVEFIDIRNYGNWGEGHLYPFEEHSTAVTNTQLMTLYNYYINAFTNKSKLSVPYGSSTFSTAYGQCVDAGVGMRRDGLMAPSGVGGNDGSDCSRAIGYSPIIWEFFGTYANLETNGWWNNTTFINNINSYKPNYIGMGQWGSDAAYMLSQQPSVIDQAANLMGYRFIITQATHYNTIQSGVAKTVNVSWHNDGVTKLYDKCTVKLALLNTSTNAVVATYTTSWNAKNWAAGTTTNESASATFSGVSAGTYKLAVGLFLNSGDTNPSYQLGIGGKTTNNWYVLDNITVS